MIGNLLKKSKRATCVMAMMGAISLSSVAEARDITIYAVEKEGLHQMDGDGEFDAILRGAFYTDRNDVEVVTLPPEEAIYDFNTCSSCCLSGVNRDPEFYDFVRPISSDPMSVSKLVIFTQPGSETLNRVSDLKGKRVSGRNGIPYSKAVEKSDISLMRNMTTEGNIRLLQSGQIDAFLAYVPAAYMVFNKMGLEAFPHDASAPLAMHEDAVICKGKAKDIILPKLNEFLANRG